jgi:CRP/FNR family transcriptional regulator, cyclic AMP receptor protein
VNRHLQQFKHDGILSIGREKVAIKDLDLLLEKARSQFPPPF